MSPVAVDVVGYKRLIFEDVDNLVFFSMIGTYKVSIHTIPLLADMAGIVDSLISIDIHKIVELVVDIDISYYIGVFALVSK